MKQFDSYSPWTRRLFDFYLNWNFRKNFSQIACPDLERLKAIQDPILFVANHVSWWDGFFLFEIQRRIRPQAQLYTIALEKTCRENAILRKMGVLPINPGNPASLKAVMSHLKQLRKTLNPQELCVSFFPQGKIRPSFLPELGFQRGVEGIASVLLPVAVVPVGIHIEPMVGKKPTAILSLGETRILRSDQASLDIQTWVQEALQLTHTHLFQNGEEVPASFEKW